MNNPQISVASRSGGLFVAQACLLNMVGRKICVFQPFRVPGSRTPTSACIFMFLHYSGEAGDFLKLLTRRHSHHFYPCFFSQSESHSYTSLQRRNGSAALLRSEEGLLELAFLTFIPGSSLSSLFHCGLSCIASGL